MRPRAVQRVERASADELTPHPQACRRAQRGVPCHPEAGPCCHTQQLVTSDELGSSLSMGGRARTCHQVHCRSVAVSRCHLLLGRRAVVGTHPAPVCVKCCLYSARSTFLLRPAVIGNTAASGGCCEGWPCPFKAVPRLLQEASGGRGSPGPLIV